MKKLLVLLSVVFGMSAFACPDFTGKYMCETEDGQLDETTIVTNGNVYTMTDNEGTQTVVADGQERRGDEGMMEKAFCDGDAMVLVAKGDFDGNSFSATSRTRKINGNLVSEVKINFNGYEENQTQVCTAL
ncbi:MAG: hypothetical protein GY909_04195 [Oligoflexia bacterium]|nr:hypothetical protein [Oligoflexia bacterium]